MSVMHGIIWYWQSRVRHLFAQLPRKCPEVGQSIWNRLYDVNKATDYKMVKDFSISFGMENLQFYAVYISTLLTHTRVCTLWYK